MLNGVSNHELAQMESFLADLDIKPLDDVAAKAMAARVLARYAAEKARLDRGEGQQRQVVTQEARHPSNGTRPMLFIGSNLATAAAVLACVMLNHWGECFQPATSAPTGPAASGLLARVQPDHVMTSLKPSAAVAREAPKSKQQSVREYKVKPGETLSEIAIRELGSTSRMQEIMDLNPNVLTDFDILPLKTILLPDGPRPAVASVDSSTYRQD